MQAKARLILKMKITVFWPRCGLRKGRVLARKRIGLDVRAGKSRAGGPARLIYKLPKNLRKSGYSAAAWRRSDARAGTAQGRAGASSALAAQITDCSHRRVVFIMHIPFLRPIHWRWRCIARLCGISLSPKGKH
jgi:hypothetical protein